MFHVSARQTTMIGSMPHTDAEKALDILDRYPLSIPVWPQLPKRSFKEAMVPQYSEGFPGISVDEENKRLWIERNDEMLNEMASFYEAVLSDSVDAFSISSSYAEGFTAFCNRLEKQAGKIPFVKGQVTGPFTYGLSLNDNDSKAVWFDEQYKDIVVKGLAQKAVWQAEQLKKYAEQVVIFFDEPIFSALGTPTYIGIQDEEVVSVLNELSETLHSIDVVVGVHCCGNMDWSLLARSAIDIIAFDAYEFGDKVALYPEAINAFLERGGVLAWGIVPTGNPADIKKETGDTLKQKIDELMALFIQKGMSSERLQKQILFTPSCGMGTLSPDDAELVLKLLMQIGPDGC